jgi:predicted DNA-binding transcriptional regulator YafY
MDRLSEPSGSGARFRPRELPAQDAAAFVRAGISSAWNTYEVDVVVDAPADQVRARIGRWATVEPDGDVRCRVRMSTDSLDWPLMALGTVGAEFSVVSPPELVGRLRDWGGRFSRAAAG